MDSQNDAMSRSSDMAQRSSARNWTSPIFRFLRLMMVCAGLAATGHADNASLPFFAWVRPASGQTGGILSPTGIFADSTGNCYVSGLFAGSVDVGGTNLTTTQIYDSFLAKFSPRGDLIWAREADVNPNSYFFVNAFVVDQEGNSLVTGHHAGSAGVISGAGMFIAKFSPEGRLVWANDVVPNTDQYG